MNSIKSIFEEYYINQELQDRFFNGESLSVTVIIPILHTNELWKANLYSIYREIPVKELIISDGGCIDDSIEIVKDFPRVKILDHSKFKTLGYSIRKMIEEVNTEWFLYFHSDVYLPKGWFDEMLKHKDNYEWFGCKMRQTVMVEYDLEHGERPWFGTQMGKKELFLEGIKTIEDDYVYRQEEFVFSDIIKKAGGREGKISSTFHYHQTMKKPSPTGRQVKSVKINVDMNHDEEIRSWDMQMKGIVKYLQPDLNILKTQAIGGAHFLITSGVYNSGELYRWIKENNPTWLPIIRKGVIKLQVKNMIRDLAKNIAILFKLK